MRVDVKGEIGLLNSFAKQLGTKPEKDGTLFIPKNYGEGYVKGYDFHSGLRMMIRDYELNEDLVVKRDVSKISQDRVIISFQNIFSFKTNKRSTPIDIRQLPSVQVASGNIDSEVFFPSKTKFHSIILAVGVPYLRDILDLDLSNSILKTIRANNQNFLFEEIIPFSIQKIVSEMMEVEIPQELSDLYFRIKAEELICLLFSELLKRENTPISAINVNDVQTIYTIRNKVLATLDTPPVLTDLAPEAGMSESKLKRLFKQVFGNSVFNYYQSFRMKEAANLLKENKLSVSEVGYNLGFSNLSHFTKVFETHIGVKPKKYSLANYSEE